ncbi:MAG TPA: SRPBCC family protein [Vicinamibacteria bacterium]
MDSIAKASVTVNAPARKVWTALVTPEIVKQYMAGATVASDWSPGSPITWKGEWKGKPFEDKGVILAAEPGRRLQYTHFSPASGQPDRPENYHTVTVELAEQGGHTTVSLTQDKNPTEEARRHSEENWEMMLDGLKKAVEG